MWELLENNNKWESVCRFAAMTAGANAWVHHQSLTTSIYLRPIGLWHSSNHSHQSQCCIVFGRAWLRHRSPWPNVRTFCWCCWCGRMCANTISCNLKSSLLNGYHFTVGRRFILTHSARARCATRQERMNTWTHDAVALCCSQGIRTLYTVHSIYSIYANILHVFVATAIKRLKDDFRRITIVRRRK